MIPPPSPPAASSGARKVAGDAAIRSFQREVEAALLAAGISRDDVLYPALMAVARAPSVLAEVADDQRWEFLRLCWSLRLWTLTFLAILMAALAVGFAVVHDQAHRTGAALERFGRGRLEAQVRAETEKEVALRLAAAGGAVRVLTEVPLLPEQLASLSGEEAETLARILRDARAARPLEMRQEAGAPFPCLGPPAVLDGALALQFTTPAGPRPARACLVLLPERLASPPIPPAASQPRPRPPR